MWFGPKPARPQKTPEDVRREILRGEAYDPVYFPAVLSEDNVRLMTLVDVRLFWHGRPMLNKAAIAVWLDDELFDARVVNLREDRRSMPITKEGSPAMWRAIEEAGRCQ
jgi:hypothetical protein